MIKPRSFTKNRLPMQNRCPHWHRFLKESLGGHPAKLRRLQAYIRYRVKPGFYRKSPMRMTLTGPGLGKSVCMKLIEAVAGPPPKLTPEQAAHASNLSLRFTRIPPNLDPDLLDKLKAEAGEIILWAYEKDREGGYGRNDRFY